MSDKHPEFRLNTAKLHDSSIIFMKDHIQFFVEAEETLRLDSEGMMYKGERIEDAGRAYKAFCTLMNKWEEKQ